MKCYACGEVGHKMQDCLEEENIMNPCHLCASTQHDASSCHNIVCFQCNEFGHHSRDCKQMKKSFSGKPTVCTMWYDLFFLSKYFHHVFINKSVEVRRMIVEDVAKSLPLQRKMWKVLRKLWNA